MSDRLAGKVAFITGAARGQGRAHAVRMAKEGADIIAVDLAGPLPPCVPYNSATPADLAETERLVKEAGRRILASVGDTRDLDGLRKAVDDGVAEFGRLDIIVANAGISAQKIIDGGRGGSIVLISSAAGIKLQPSWFITPRANTPSPMARAFAAELGRHSIRVTSVHPGPVATDMGSGDMVGALTGAAIPIRNCRNRDAVSAGLDPAAGGHRRHGVLAGLRRIEIRSRRGNLG